MHKKFKHLYYVKIEILNYYFNIKKQKLMLQIMVEKKTKIN